ncbi:MULTISPECIES: DUF3306 domain-containing protein [Pseudomonadati]|uniref:DUF3306 domain-containing protein n=1 Tax=Shewanella aestuarii TaxID=1028752 RepID=A0ABT0L464_9GAMM|nr:DUF3306 domain-containing protein [Shewanella aestuarii]MCL1118527.1 DUF3306 domain-containing protein [Shewanella aestuarii]GGN82951.1 hypothetical protein GCM10009193_30650 [Shewanella aestuarii]
MSGLLSRWNQRRENVAKEAEQQGVEQLESSQIGQMQTDDTAPLTSQTADVNHSVQQDEQAATDTVLQADELPDPDSIEVGGSFASFMAKNVDPAAKAAALRALWKQPQYGHIDGLLEYALDYTNQPKLSAEVSAELAKKVFKHVIEKEEAPEDETLETTQSDALNDSSDPEPETARVSAENQQISSTDLENVDANQALASMEAQSDELQSHSFTGDAVKAS